MSLDPGHKLAHYEILEPIGKGGMGEVYRAKDGKLGRDVAIKVLPDEFAQDEERLRRFQREAKVLASLNHPNIASIYGLEQSGETHYLVLELVPGETLAERIARGPIPVDEALEIATKIAEALEEAHEQGIVHRDLKPANVKLTEDDKVKVLDFGLAKAFAEDGPEGDAATSMSPTITRDATRVGVILGTAAYMSPEQAKGKRVDKRSDIFAFGTLLYEMLTGKRAFPGDDVSEVLASVIKLEPDLSVLPTPARAFTTLIERCLAKDPRRRLRDVGDARLELADPALRVGPTEAIELRRWRPLHIGLGAVALLGAGFLGWVLNGSDTAADDAVERFSINMPGFLFSAAGAVAVSPNEKVLAFASGREGAVYLRRIDGWSLTSIAGSEGGTDPFFSPDSRYLGFHVSGEIRKVRLDGSTSESIAEVTSRPRGATWTEGNLIYYAQRSGLLRAPADGGTPEMVLELDQSAGHRQYTWPEVLPGGAGVLLTVEHNDQFDTFVYDVAAKELRVLVEGATNARYAPSGHLIASREGSLEAIPFDLANLEVTGAPKTVIERVAMTGGLAQGFTLSRHGMLIYVTDREPDRSFVLVDRSGNETRLSQETASFGRGWLGEPRFSPDGERLAVTNYDAREGRLCDTLLLDLRRGTATRLTFDGDNHAPIWSPDGKRVTYTKVPSLYEQLADASRPPELLHAVPEDVSSMRPLSWSPDGRTLLMQTRLPNTGYDVFALSADGESEVFLQTRFQERHAQFSPDGNWVAYASDETGRWEVYLRPFPGPGVKLPVSTDGGTAPRWSSSGEELFFRAPSSAPLPDERALDYAMMVVDVELDATPELGRPRLLFEDRDYSPSQYDASPDGSRFVMIKGSGGSTLELHVVRNWLQEVSRLTSDN